MAGAALPLSRGLAAVLLGATLGACVGDRRPPPTRPPAPPAPATTAYDASYDWRGLVTAPMGSRLQELAQAADAHEVIVFQGDSATAAREEGECIAPPGPPPRFLGRTATGMILCYVHGRLERFEADVLLAREEGAEAFQRFCDHWQTGATQTTRSAERCRGQDGNLAFEALLGDADEDSRLPLSIVVYDAAAAAERDQQ